MGRNGGIPSVFSGARLARLGDWNKSLRGGFPESKWKWKAGGPDCAAGYPRGLASHTADRRSGGHFRVHFTTCHCPLTASSHHSLLKQ